jgi:NDP-sugar pyrophosphorylase family protein
MAPVAGRPFLHYLLRMVQAAGFRRVVLCVGYRHEEIEAWAGDGSALGLEISYSVEDKPLGTAGALRLAVARFSIEGDFLAMNGDTLVEVDFEELSRVHLRNRARATMVLAHSCDTSRYGRVDFDEEGCVTAFLEKSSTAGESYINAGVYLFGHRVLNDVPEDIAVSLEREVLPRLVGKGLFSIGTRNFFIDIGVPEDFSRAQVEFKERFQ